MRFTSVAPIPAHGSPSILPVLRVLEDQRINSYTCRECPKRAGAHEMTDLCRTPNIPKWGHRYWSWDVQGEILNAGPAINHHPLTVRHVEVIPRSGQANTSLLSAFHCQLPMRGCQPKRSDVLHIGCHRSIITWVWSSDQPSECFN